jgi:hypothetical protein
MSSPRVILWDIETSHNLMAVFNLLNRDGYLPSDNILQERYIISAAWKELGTKSVKSVSLLDFPQDYRNNPHSDKGVCVRLHEILSGADVIVAHNGDSYDIKFAETRMLAHGLKPLPPIPSIDTLSVARKRFLFNANNLDYLGQYLGVGRKKSTEKGLWLKVLQGNREAIRKMVSYNKQDVALLERVFLKLQPYVANHINRQLLGGDGCPRCGSATVQSRGVHRAVSRVYQRFQCTTCGGWFRRVKAESVKTTMRVL